MRARLKHTTGPHVEYRRNNQATNCKSQQTSCSLRNNFVELLLDTVDTTEKEAHSHNQEQVGKHTSNQGSLNNSNFVMEQGNDGNNQFDCVSETSVQKTSQSFSSSVARCLAE